MDNEIKRMVRVYYCADDEYGNYYHSVAVTFSRPSGKTVVSYKMPGVEVWQHKQFLKNLKTEVEKYETSN